MAPVNSRRAARRAVLTLVLWAGFWLLAAGVVATLAWVPIAESLYSGGVGWAGGFSGLGALTVLWALRPRWRSRHKGEISTLSRAQFPELFALIEDVARRVGTKAPHKVHLADQATAFITLERKWFGLRREGLVGVGFPLFALLNREELESVLAHEFGHHAGGDLTLGPWVYRTRAAIASAVERLEDSAFFLDVPFRLYGQLFLRVSGAVSRQQELAADALAARICGSEATARALHRVHILAPYWSAYLTHEVIPYAERRVRVPLLEGFKSFLAEKSRRADIERELEEEARRPPSPWDSHPPFEERLRSLGHDMASEGEDLPLKELEAGGCLELLGGAGAVDDVFYTQMTHGGLVSLHWNELGEKILLPEIAKQLTGGALDPRRVPLTALPSMLREGAALWDRARHPGLDVFSPEGKRQRARLLLGQWLAAALVVRGFKAELRPGANLRVEHEGHFVEPAAIVDWLTQGVWSDEQYQTWCSLIEQL